MENLKNIKSYIKLFSDRAQYLHYDFNNDIWYYVVDILGDGLGLNNTGTIVLSKVKFHDTFTSLMLSTFPELFDIIKSDPNHYFISIPKLGQAIDKVLNKKTETIEIDKSLILIHVGLNIEEFINMVTNKTTGIVYRIDLKQKGISATKLELVDVSNIISDKPSKNKLIVPIKSGHCVNFTYVRSCREEAEFYLQLYKRQEGVYNYSIIYKNPYMEVESIQPFTLFYYN